MIAQWERAYLLTLNHLYRKGSGENVRADRTGVGTASIFGHQLEIPLVGDVLPALVTKTVHLPSMLHELIWFLHGETNIAYLQENKVRIWDAWADDKGDLGPVYGSQWRSWEGVKRGHVDQMAVLLDQLLTTPFSRRMVVSAWNPDVLPNDRLNPRENASCGLQALAPCHMAFQAYVSELTLDEICERAAPYVPAEVAQLLTTSRVTREEREAIVTSLELPRHGLSLRVDQRSADWMLGVPFNVASYATLTHILAAMVNIKFGRRTLTPHRLVMQFGDCHLYSNHREAAKEQLHRADNLEKYGDCSYPRIELNLPDDVTFDTLSYEMIKFKDYQAAGKIPAPIAV